MLFLSKLMDSSSGAAHQSYSLATGHIDFLNESDLEGDFTEVGRRRSQPRLMRAANQRPVSTTKPRVFLLLRTTTLQMKSRRSFPTSVK